MASPIDQDFFARLRVLNDKFEAGIPGMLDRMREQRHACDPAAPDAACIKALQETLHTIAGSGATFGFRLFGQQARTLEQRLRVLMTFDAVAPDQWQCWLEALDAYIDWAGIDPKAEVNTRAPPGQ